MGATKITALRSGRVAAVRRRLRGLQAQALLLTNPRDIRYVTGFVGDDSWALVLASSARVHILSDARFTEQIQREAPQAQAHIRQKGLADELQLVAAKFRLHKVAVQPEYLTLAQRQTLGKKVKGVRWMTQGDGMIAQRAVKDEEELRCIRRAAAIQQQAFKEVLTTLKPGVREVEVAAELEHRMRALGADGPSFATIVAADANASLPHAIPGSRKLRAGGIVLIDWGARYGGYCSDMTRVVALGRWPKKIAEIYRICLQAQQAGIAAIAPGKSVKAVDAAARDVIKKAGYGDYFGHSLGHGLGLDIHEQPVLSWRAEDVLKPGQVVTAEPGIYLPGVGGVRLEDDVLVTAKGHAVLTDLPLDMDSMTV